MPRIFNPNIDRGLLNETRNARINSKQWRKSNDDKSKPKLVHFDAIDVIKSENPNYKERLKEGEGSRIYGYSRWHTKKDQRQKEIDEQRKKTGE